MKTVVTKRGGGTGSHGAYFVMFTFCFLLIHIHSTRHGIPVSNIYIYIYISCILDFGHEGHTFNPFSKHMASHVR